MKKYKRYLRFQEYILDTTKCTLEQLTKQDCFVDSNGFTHYSSEILNQSDDLDDLWKNGDLVEYQDLDLESTFVDFICGSFNPFTNERQIPYCLYCNVGKDYKCLMIKDQRGEWELCL